MIFSFRIPFATNARILVRHQRQHDILSGKNPQLYNHISGIVRLSIGRNFQAAGRPKWPPRKYPYPWPPLIKTGEMQQKTLKSAKGPWIHTKSIHRLVIRSPFYGPFHQYGTVHLPIRKYVSIQDREHQAIMQEIHRVLVEP